MYNPKLITRNRTNTNSSSKKEAHASVAKDNSSCRIWFFASSKSEATTFY